MASHLTLDLSNLIQKQMVVVRLTFARKMLRVFKSLTIDFQSHFKYSMIMTNGVRHDDSWNDLEQSIELWRTNNDDIISLKIVFFLKMYFSIEWLHLSLPMISSNWMEEYSKKIELFAMTWENSIHFITKQFSECEIRYYAGTQEIY